MIVVEGLGGVVELAKDGAVKLITKAGTQVLPHPAPSRYRWAMQDDVSALGDELIEAIVAAQRNILEEIRWGRAAETTGAAYVKTMRITFAAIQSALSGQAVTMAF